MKNKSVVAKKNICYVHTPTTVMCVIKLSDIRCATETVDGITEMVSLVSIQQKS